MATYSKVLLSESVNGKAVAVSGIPTTIHTAQSGTDGIDEVWLYANNIEAETITLAITWGGGGYDEIFLDIPPKSGLILVVPGLPINNGQVIQGYASNYGLGISGYVNRITA